VPDLTVAVMPTRLPKDALLGVTAAAVLQEVVDVAVACVVIATAVDPATAVKLATRMAMKMRPSVMNASKELVLVSPA